MNEKDKSELKQLIDGYMCLNQLIGKKPKLTRQLSKAYDYCNEPTQDVSEDQQPQKGN